MILAAIAFIEIIIGFGTLVGLAVYPIFFGVQKPLNIFIFVLISAVFSTTLGAGLLSHKSWARTLLVFFSGYVIITKVLAFFGLLILNGEFITTFPANLKNMISVAYHGFLIIFLTHKTIKDKFIVAAAVFFILAGRAEAAPTYGADMPDKGKVSMGYQNNTVFKHDLADMYGNIKSTQNFFDISYGVYRWLSVEGKIGMGDILQKGGIHPKVEYDQGFAGGYGFRIRAMDEAKYKIGLTLGFHHISVHPKNRTINNDHYESILDDWQASIVASKTIGRFTPFVGGKAGTCDLIYKVNKIDRKRRPPLYYGGAVFGCAVKLNKELSVRVESHFIDETALSAGAYYTF